MTTCVVPSRQAVLSLCTTCPFSSPFELSPIVVRSCRHDGQALGIDAVESFRVSSTQAIKDIMVGGRIDSPVCTFLPLSPPSRKPADLPAKASPPVAAETPPASLAALLDGTQEAAKAERDFITAQSLPKAARKMAANDSCVVQQLALATYKSKLPDETQALEQARIILLELNPLHANNADPPLKWIKAD
jgi:hypothetical protein